MQLSAPPSTLYRATLIKEMDKLYSKGSRLATELGGPVCQHVALPHAP